MELIWTGTRCRIKNLASTGSIIASPFGNERSQSSKLMLCARMCARMGENQGWAGGLATPRDCMYSVSTSFPSYTARPFFRFSLKRCSMTMSLPARWKVRCNKEKVTVGALLNDDIPASTLKVRCNKEIFFITCTVGWRSSDVWDLSFNERALVSKPNFGVCLQISLDSAFKSENSL